MTIAGIIGFTERPKGKTEICRVRCRAGGSGVETRVGCRFHCRAAGIAG